MMILRKFLYLFVLILLCGMGVGIGLPHALANGDVRTYSTQKININKSHKKPREMIMPRQPQDTKKIIIMKTEDLVPPMMDAVVPNDVIFVEKTIEETAAEVTKETIEEVIAPPQPIITENFRPKETIIEQPVNVSDAEYILGPEDKIKITVFGEKDLSGNYKLGGDGTISMPLIGVINVQNLSLRQAEQEIENKFKEGYLKKPSVSIEVAESRPFYVMGEVRRPGSYNYINGMNVLQAVAISGGFTYRANKKFVDIIRGNATTPQEPKPYAPEAFIRAGDIIFVRERFF